MSRLLLVIENLSGNENACLQEKIQLFRPQAWVVVRYVAGKAQITHSHENVVIPSDLKDPLSPLTMLAGLMKTLPEVSTLVRLRDSHYPLPAELWQEICNEFPEKDFRYVLSTAEECGLDGFFLERMNREALAAIAQLPVSVMPSGYLNGMALEAAGRHWLSLPLRRFYLQEHFENILDSPRSVAINAVPQCNYHCMKCQYHSPKQRANRSFASPMDLDRFRVLLEKCKAYHRLTSVSPTISGEPLLHPKIHEIVRMIKDAGYACGFATNGSLLTEAMTERLLDAGIDSLAFSVDASSPETYAKLQGGDLHAVEHNILTFQRATLRTSGTFSGSMIFVVSAENMHEIGEYRRKWLDRGFTVGFSAEHQIQSEATPFFADMRWAPKYRMPCFSPFLGLYLSVEGRLLSCGATAGFRGFRESLFDYEPAALWRCRTLQRLRELQLSGNAPGYCKHFSCWTGKMATWMHSNGRLICHTQGFFTETPASPSRNPRSAPLREWAAWVRRCGCRILGRMGMSIWRNHQPS